MHSNPIVLAAGMADRVGLLWPELLLLAAAMVVALMGLSKDRTIRGLVGPVSIFAVLASGVLALFTGGAEAAAAAGVPFPALSQWLKPMVALIAAGLMAIQGGFVDQALEAAIGRNAAAFNPLRAIRGEFHAFALFSIAGVMLLTTATDLIWLFLALELVSLPTYVMVAIGRGDRPGLEAAVKYFFLGAMATAVMLMGFALLYGATGSLQFDLIRNAFGAQAATGGIALLGVGGLMLTSVGLFFKITAVPMHFYAPDVYEGAPLPVTAFLSFIPKVAGFVGLILVLGTAGLTSGELPKPIIALLWMAAILTMSLGNIGALLQRSMKRTMAYSSIAHSGYMLVALAAGTTDALDALLFYLFAYGVTTVATFGGLAVIQRAGGDADRFEDLAGLRRTHPWATWMIVLGALSFTGIPPLLGFFGKFWILTSAFEAGQIALCAFLVVNSLVSARYYLRFMATPVVAEPDSNATPTERNPSLAPVLASVAFGVALLVLPCFTGSIFGWVQQATDAPAAVTQAADSPAVTLSQSADSR